VGEEKDLYEKNRDKVKFSGKSLEGDRKKKDVMI